MDTAYRWALLGLGAMTATLVVRQIDFRSRDFSDSDLRVLSTVPEPNDLHQRLGELMLDRRLEVRTGGVLSVDVGDGDVEVRSGTDGSASVKVWAQARDMEWAREVFERMQFQVEEEGGGVSVRSRDPRIRDYEWRNNRGLGFTIEITVPERFDLDIRTSDGDVDIGSVQGRVNLHTSDGEIVLGTLRGSEISIETSDGDVTAELLEAERITVRTSDGNVRVRATGANMRVTTSDGDIRLDLLDQGEVELRTGDGDITVYASPSLQADLELHGSDVQVDFEMQMVGRIGRSGARGRLNGGGPLLTARTGDGTIMIRRSPS